MDENENKDVIDQDNVDIKTDKNGIIKFANLLFVLSTISIVLSGVLLFSLLGLLLYYLLLIIVLFLTLFTLMSKLKPWFEFGESIQQFIEAGYQYIPYIIGVGALMSLGSLVIYITQRNYIHRTSKIITNIVILVLFLVAAVLRFVIFSNN